MNPLDFLLAMTVEDGWEWTVQGFRDHCTITLCRPEWVMGGRSVVLPTGHGKTVRDALLDVLKSRVELTKWWVKARVEVE